MRNPRRGSQCTLILLLGFVGCAANDTSANSPCQAATAGKVAIALGDVLYVAADSQSTLYVLDRPTPHDHRFFVSNGLELVRRPILGKGEFSTASGDLIMITFEDGATPSTFFAQDKPGGDVILALLRNQELRDKQSIPTDAEPLSKKDPELISPMTVVDLPSARTVEYFAMRKDGAYLYIDRPTHDSAYEDFRLFYGTSSDMEQRRITNVTRFKDGGSTYIDFELDGRPAYTLFCTPMLDDPPYLFSLDGEEEYLTRLDPGDATIGDMVLTCHDLQSSFQPPPRHSATVEATCGP